MNDPVLISEKVREFLEDLTELSQKHGLGISQDGVIFVLEGFEDTQLVYATDPNDKITFR